MRSSYLRCLAFWLCLELLAIAYINIDPCWEIIRALRRTINLLVTNPRITEWLTVEGLFLRDFSIGVKMTRVNSLLDNGHFITA